MSATPRAIWVGQWMVRRSVGSRGELARIAVPTMLVWGRHDRANRLRVAEAASDHHGWPLHVIDDAADDPPRTFLDVLQQVLD